MRRRWLSKGLRRSWKGRFQTAADALDVRTDWLPFDVDLGEAVLVLALAVAAILILVPLFLFGIELIVLGWALASGLIGRVVLHRPWVVEARPAGRPEQAQRWAAVGWRRSTKLMDEIAANLAAGLALPAGEQAAA